jgi:predicted transcriptional regulator
MSAHSQPDAAHAELEVLAALWRTGPARVRAVREALARESA